MSEFLFTAPATAPVSPSMTASFEENFSILDSPTGVLESQEFLGSLDSQINKRISQGIKQAMRVVINKLDAIIELKMATFVSDVDHKQNNLETKLMEKMFKLKNDLSETQHKKERFYEQTMSQRMELTQSMIIREGVRTTAERSCSSNGRGGEEPAMRWSKIVQFNRDQQKQPHNLSQSMLNNEPIGINEVDSQPINPPFSSINVVYEDVQEKQQIDIDQMEFETENLVESIVEMDKRSRQSSLSNSIRDSITRRSHIASLLKNTGHDNLWNQAYTQASKTSKLNDLQKTTKPISLRSNQSMESSKNQIIESNEESLNNSEVKIYDSEQKLGDSNKKGAQQIVKCKIGDVLQKQQQQGKKQRLQKVNSKTKKQIIKSRNSLVHRSSSKTESMHENDQEQHSQSLLNQLKSSIQLPVRYPVHKIPLESHRIMKDLTRVEEEPSREKSNSPNNSPRAVIQRSFLSHRSKQINIEINGENEGSRSATRADCKDESESKDQKNVTDSPFLIDIKKYKSLQIATTPPNNHEQPQLVVPYQKKTKQLQPSASRTSLISKTVKNSHRRDFSFGQGLLK